VIQYRLMSPLLGLAVNSPTHGSPGWSSVALLLTETETVVIDPGGPGYRAQWDGWLAAAGRTRDDVSRVFLTHTHWDHVGAASWFPGATVYASNAELEWALAHADADPHLHPGLVRSLADTHSLVGVEDGDEIGGVQAIFTPGHTPGHTSYLLSTNDGRLLVVGDAVKNGYELSFGNFAATADGDASAVSLARIKAAAIGGAAMLLGHDGIYTCTTTGVQRVCVAEPHLRVLQTDGSVRTVYFAEAQ
jgi:glyoxylase-like metal-dependent hydrolase (beta-lactamase superfamily II)